MISPQASRNIKRIIPFGIIWSFFGLIYSLLEKGILGDLDHYPSTLNPYDFQGNLVVTVVFTFITGILVGAFEVIYLNPAFINKSFAKKIIYKTFFYALVIVVFLMFVALVNNSFKFQTNIFDERVWNALWAFFSNFAFWSAEIYISSIIGISLFYAEVSDNLGQGVLNNFFTGRYHQPIEEERIFMFLDMKSSTAIAEKLGHNQYFKMLKEYYADISPPIVQNKGEIYQYVGDEVVVSWTLKEGLYDNHFLRCYFEMKKALKDQEKKYDAKYGLMPSFKAGFHVGKVTTGEIGVLKKDIIFTGDVLNTTARIQGLCNQHKVDVLISVDLKKMLYNNSNFKFRSVGENELRGRDEKIMLYTIETA